MTEVPHGLILPGHRDFKVGPAEINQMHSYSDVDTGPDAQHHTLGGDPNNAAPGNHDHGMTELLKRWLDSKTGTHSIPGSENPGVTVWYPSGFYDVNGSASMPDTGWWLILHLRHSNPANNYARQLAFGFASNRTNYTRAIENNVAGGWGALGF